MKRLPAILLVSTIWCLAGCAGMTATRTAPNGEVMSLASHRFIWQTGKAAFSLTDSNGMTIKLEIENSRADAEMAGAVAGAVAKALVQAPATALKP